jgi:hypothetical protein
MLQNWCKIGVARKLLACHLLNFHSVFTSYLSSLDYSKLQVKKIVVEKQIDPDLNITLL